jgi:hypothetical protein
MSTQCPGLFPLDALECSGRGACVAAATCQCLDPRWSGVGDFVYGAPSCNMYLPAVVGLWALLAASHLLELVFVSGPFLVAKWQKVRTSSELMCLSTKSAHCWMLLQGVCIVLSNLTFAAAGVIRATLPLAQTVGNDALVTVLFSFACFFFFSACAITLMIFCIVNELQTAVKETGMLLGLFYKVKYALMVGIWLVAAVGSFAPSFLLGSASMSAANMYAMGVVHYLFVTQLVFICGVVLVPFLLGDLIADVRQALSRQQHVPIPGNINQVLFRLEVFRRLTVSLCLFNSVVGTVIGVWPCLQALSSYSTPIFFTSGTAFLYVAMLVGKPVKKSPMSSNQQQVSPRVALKGMNELTKLSGTLGSHASVDGRV